MHNLSNYDAHLFVRELSKCPGKLNVIPETAEKYIFISKSLKVGEYFNKKLEKAMPINRELRFLDSFRFLPSSLDKLASNLTSDKLHNLRNCYPEGTSLNSYRIKGCIHMTTLMTKQNYRVNKYPRNWTFTTS